MLDPSRIIGEHVKSIRDETGRAPSYAVFLLLPILFSFLPVLSINNYITHSFGTSLILVFSILTILLLLMSFLSFGTFSGADRQDYKADSNKRRLAKALQFNVLYTTLISITTLTVLLLCAFSGLWYWESLFVVPWPVLIPVFAQFPASFLVYFLVLHFVANLLLILKRLESLVSLDTESVS